MKPLTRLPNATALELLPPCAATLATLAEAAAEASSVRWPACLRSDPGALLAALQLPPPVTAATVLHHLAGQTVRVADWSVGTKPAVYRLSQAVAVVAEHLAQVAGENVLEVGATGLLAPLGTLVRAQQGEPLQAAAEEYLHTRRLVRRWRLPAWLHHTLLHLDLSLPMEEIELPANRRVLLVQAALAFVQREHGVSVVPVPATFDQLLESLHIDGKVARALSGLLSQPPELPTVMTPAATDLLLRTLRATLRAVPTEAVTAVDDVEAELEELRNQLARHHQQEQQHLFEQKLAALAEFAAGASHEINNPLAVISAQAQHLLKTEESLDRAKGLERIIGQANRIHLLLRDLLLYARPPQPSFRPTSMHKLVAEAVAQVSDVAVAREVRLDVVLPPARLKGTVDAELTTIALVCLLQNAIAAAPTHGYVRVAVETEASGTLAVIVEDNGPGVADEGRPHLFDPFYSGRRAGRGAGLGLSKVWRIAQLHGGSITFTSVPAEPTRFILRLPRSTALAPSRQAARATRGK